MGIHDREYYRDETSGSGWLTGVAPVTRALILINVGLFLLQWLARDWNVTKYLASSSSRSFSTAGSGSF